MNTAFYVWSDGDVVLGMNSGPSWAPIGPSWAILDASWVLLGPSWDLGLVLKASWAHLGQHPACRMPSGRRENSHPTLGQGERLPRRMEGRGQRRCAGRAAEQVRWRPRAAQDGPGRPRPAWKDRPRAAQSGPGRPRTVWKGRPRAALDGLEGPAQGGLEFPPQDAPRPRTEIQI